MRYPSFLSSVLNAAMRSVSFIFRLCKPVKRKGIFNKAQVTTNVCAKSGTSQLGGGQKSNAMFAGFVEDEQYPLAFIVVVENGGYGSATCVPVLSKVLAACKSVLDGE